MHVLCTYRRTQRAWEVTETDFVLGRPHANTLPLLDLSPDTKVSRLHARIWQEDGCYWVEDMWSSRGTLLNGNEIKGQGKQRLQAGDLIVVGETSLRLQSVGAPASLVETNYLENGLSLASGEQPAAESVQIGRDLDVTNFEIENAGALRLKLICELPLQFAAKTELADLLPMIVDRLADLIPQGDSWALALRDPQTDALLLKAYRSNHGPHLSATLSRRAMTERRAFIWNRTFTEDMSRTILQSPICTGMYAPLLWQGEMFGVMCAESRRIEEVFAEEDLRLIIFMAQYAAMAIGSHHLREKLRDESVLSAKLLRQFSPKVAERLLKHRGNLRLGGERSEVTILNWDIRGFTKLTENMEPDEIVEMLNDYFGALVPIIFSHQGTIDKFVGDAILAVFGSPEADPRQCEHAIRASIEMQQTVAKVNDKRRTERLPCAEPAIGIHCGEVVHGFVGTASRMEYTVIGDAVNKVSRYCSGATGGQILISPELYERVWQLVEVQPATIETKHEGNFLAYSVKSIQENAARADENMKQPPGVLPRP